MDFTTDTFRYLDQAKKNQMKLPWFEKNSELYLSAVKKPMSDLVAKIWDRFEDDLPRIKIDPKRISRPKRSVRMLDSGEPLVKSETSFYLAEKATSRFEWNPGFFFELSAEEDGNILRVGLYHLISARQTRIIRQEIAENFEDFHRILNDKKLKARFGGLRGDTYTRFPKLYDPTQEYAQYLKFKLFYLCRSYSREEVTKKNFHGQVLKDMETAMPFFKWIRDRVKIYQKDDAFSRSTPQFLERDAFSVEW